MSWESIIDVLGITQTCFGHHSDMFWASFWHVLGNIQTCFGHHSEMFWASSRHVLGIIQTCFGHHPDIIQICLRYFFDTFRLFFQKLKKYVCKIIIFPKIEKSAKRHQQYPTGGYPTRGGPGAASPQEHNYMPLPSGCQPQLRLTHSLNIV